MKVAGYIRVSTKRQKEEGSHERQRNQLEAWAERNGHDITFYEDIGESGRTGDRPDYELLIKEAEKYDAVAVRELSRFGRDTIKILQDIDDLHERGVDFISLKESIDPDSAMGRAMLQVLSAFNEMKSRLAKEHAEEMIQRRREAGKPIGRPKKLPENERSEVKDLHDAGLGYRAISNLSEVDDRFSEPISPTTVKRYCED